MQNNRNEAVIGVDLAAGVVARIQRPWSTRDARLVYITGEHSAELDGTITLDEPTTPSERLAYDVALASPADIGLGWTFKGRLQ